MPTPMKTSWRRTDMPGASFQPKWEKIQERVVISRPTCPRKSTAKVEPGTAREPDFLKSVGLMCDLHSTSGKGKVSGRRNSPPRAFVIFTKGMEYRQNGKAGD